MGGGDVVGSGGGNGGSVVGSGGGSCSGLEGRAHITTVHC